MNNNLSIKFSQDHIKQFKELGILIIYIYGSQATGLANSASDIDIGIVFLKPQKYEDRTMKVYAKIYDIFTGIFSGKEVDVVLLQFASLTLQFKAASKGVVVYKQSEEAAFQYKETVIKKYANIKYFLDLRAQEVLSRI